MNHLRYNVEEWCMINEYRDRMIEFSTTVTKVEPVKVQLPADYIVKQLPEIFGCPNPYDVYKKEDGKFYEEIEEYAGYHSLLHEQEVSVSPEQEEAMMLLKPLMDYFYQRVEK